MIRTILILVAVVAVTACSGPSRSTATPVIRRALLENQGKSPTPTPFPASTLLEAWQVAQPQLRQWATDASPAEQWSCWGVLTPEGRCNYWYATLISPAGEAAAELHIKGQGVELTRLQAAPGTQRRLGAAVIDLNDAIDSPAAAQAALAWLEERQLRRPETRLTGLRVWLDPHNGACAGEIALYRLDTADPTGTICLSLAGKVVSQTYLEE